MVPWIKACYNASVQLDGVCLDHCRAEKANHSESAWACGQFSINLRSIWEYWHSSSISPGSKLLLRS